MWPDTDTTHSLLARIREGDSDALNPLLDHHRGALRKMVQQRLDPALRRRLDASDILQDVLLEASRRISEYLANGDMPFHLWLRYLARDRIIDMHRRHRVSAKRSIEREQPAQVQTAGQSTVDLLQQLKDAELTPAAAAIQQELQVQFLAALDELDSDDREILAMRHIEQLTNAQAAELLELSQPAAGMRYLRALRRLRTRLTEDAASEA